MIKKEFTLDLNNPNVWLLQDNKISFWSIGNSGASGIDDGFEGDPQLLCEHKHDGDVLDLQVRLMGIQTNVAACNWYFCKE